MGWAVVQGLVGAGQVFEMRQDGLQDQRSVGGTDLDQCRPGYRDDVVLEELLAGRAGAVGKLLEREAGASLAHLILGPSHRVRGGRNMETSYPRSEPVDEAADKTPVSIDWHVR